MENINMTIFTPTYNRAYILPNIYKSLLRQNYLDVKWVIIDDGSTDNTAELINQWISEGKVNIDYHYQENHGRFEAYNNARKYFEGELVVPVDSDDYLLDGALNKISETWNKIEDKENCSGILAHFIDESGDILGTKFPQGIMFEKQYILCDKYRIRGGKVMVYRTDLMKKVAYPIFEGEKFGGDAIIFTEINDMCPMYLLNEPLEYRSEKCSDSISNNLIRYHINSPNGMREYYKGEIYTINYQKIILLKKGIGYVGFSFFTGISSKIIINDSPKKYIAVICFIPGFMYFVWLKIQKKKLNM
jgi:glycosyltransferase involved in cell wall biosynthesis